MADNAWDIVLKKTQDMVKFDRAIKIGIQTVLATQKKRIFIEGNDSSQNKIGKYSTNPISISKKNQARDTGKTYFKGGYSEYKNLIGKNPGYINLVNTGQMSFDYAFFDLGNSTYGIGFNNSFNFDKSQWQEAKQNKKVFQQSSEEGLILDSVINQEIGKDLP